MLWIIALNKYAKEYNAARKGCGNESLCWGLERIVDGDSAGGEAGERRVQLTGAGVELHGGRVGGCTSGEGPEESGVRPYRRAGAEHGRDTQVVRKGRRLDST